jgi:predicted metal-dependent HD superfamily phosphohydrolase
MKALQTSWRKGWREVEPEDDGDEIFHALIARYAEPHRAYHTLDHIRECLRQLDLARHLLSRAGEAELAVWFHDAVYDPTRNDNEARSAEWAKKVMGERQVAGPAIQRIGELIRMTTHHNNHLTGDAALVCDADLAILGAEQPRFDAYNSAIRLEYAWVPEPAYQQGRGAVLAAFLSRPRIYHSQFFYERLEQKARANLRHAVARYSS